MVAYVDTGAWIALFDPRDGHHESAKECIGLLKERAETLVVGWHTIVELADGLESHYGQPRAAQTLTRLLASPDLRVEPSEPHRERAMEIFIGRADREVDLSDCLSFAMMEAMGIRRAFTYDTDFQKAGFEIIG